MEKLAPPQMRCGVQRPSPPVNGHWGYDDKATPSPPIISPESESGEVTERGPWTIGATQQYGLQLSIPKTECRNLICGVSCFTELHHLPDTTGGWFQGEETFDRHKLRRWWLALMQKLNDNKSKSTAKKKKREWESERKITNTTRVHEKLQQQQKEQFETQQNQNPGISDNAVRYLLCVRLYDHGLLLGHPPDTCSTE